MATLKVPCHWSIVPHTRCPLTSSTAASPALITSTLARIFLKDEVAVATATHVGIYDGDAKVVDFQDGTCLLTSHRVFFVIAVSSREEATVIEINLQQVHGGTCEVYDGFGFISHPKLIVTINPREGNLAGSVCKLSFRGGGFDSFRNAFRKCLERKLWALCSSSPPPVAVHVAATNSDLNETRSTTDVASLPPPAAVSARRSDGLSFTDRAGIGGLQRAQHIDATSNEIKSSRALIDLDSALANTVTLTQEIKKLRSQIYGDGTETSDTSLTKDDISRLVSIEEALGLKSRKDSSSLKRSDDALALAQQFYAWITHPKNEANFFSRMFVPAKELYMLYLSKGVGAEGSIATDPSLFRRALEQLEGMTTGRQGNMCKLRCFSSGALVVELGSAQQRLIATLEGTLGSRPNALTDMRSLSSTTGWKRNGIDATRLGTLLHVDTDIALELLEDLELDEVLCRDEQFGEAFGVLCSFSWNWFLLQ